MEVGPKVNQRNTSTSSPYYDGSVSRSIVAPLALCHEEAPPTSNGRKYATTSRVCTLDRMANELKTTLIAVRRRVSVPTTHSNNLAVTGLLSTDNTTR